MWFQSLTGTRAAELCARNNPRSSLARFLVLLLLLAVAILPVRSDAGRSAGAAALIIGKLPVGTRAIALGGAYAAVAEGPATVHWNPAGLAAIGRTKVEGLHVEQGEEIRIEGLLIAQPMARGATLGVGIGYLSQPPIVGTLEDGSGNYAGISGEFSAYEFKGVVGYGQDLSRLAPVSSLGVLWERGAIGASLSMLGESIAGTRSFSTAIDLGYLYADGNAGRTVGLVVRNLGMQVRGAPLPVIAEAGVAQVTGNWLIAFDLLTASDDALRFRGGVEWTFPTATGGVSLRAGFQHSLSSSLSAPFSGGLGYEVALPGKLEIALDYAFVPVTDFSDMHAISIRVGL